MGILQIAWRSIQQRGLASFLTAFSLCLGVALVSAVLLVSGFVHKYFGGDTDLGFNMVVGSKGSGTQLVLNSVYHLDRTLEPLPYSFYKEFTEGEFAKAVHLCVPICMGDTYQGFRVVGTTVDFCDKLASADRTPFRFARGRNFHSSAYFEAVIGSAVAQATGLAVEGSFQPVHGVDASHVHDPFKVVGVLAPTGTPVDNALYINIEGFYLLDNHAKMDEPTESKVFRMTVQNTTDAKQSPPPAEAEHDHDEHAHDDHDHDDHDHAEHDHAEPTKEAAATAAPASTEHDHAHDDHAHEDHDHAEAAHDEHDHDAHDEHDHDAHEGHDHDGHDHGHAHEPLPESQREVTALLINVDPLNSPGLAKKINEGNVAQAALPILVIQELLDAFVKPLTSVLMALAVLIVLVSSIGILVSIYNSMSERRREIAIMRALGASRNTVMGVILCESLMLTLVGGFCGWLLGRALVFAAKPWITQLSGGDFGLLYYNPYEFFILPGLVVAALLAGLLPSMLAYRVDVSKSLAP